MNHCAEFQKLVIEKVESQLYEIRELKGLLLQVLATSNTEQPAVPTLPSLPIKTKEDLDQVEIWLQDKSNETLLVIIVTNKLRIN